MAGAGGNQGSYKLGDRAGVSIITGNYGQAGELFGYEGKIGVNESYPTSYFYPGDPGEQTKGGQGGLCKMIEGARGENGTFGKGGTSGISYTWSQIWDTYFYHGSGGYYGSGGSSGGIFDYWYPAGTAGGSSFISGHRGCDAISEDSTESNIIHTKYPYHYSGLVFTDTVMIDGSGREWINETSGML